MKVKNSKGREFYIQRAKDDRMANWCSRLEPVRLEFDGTLAEAYADPDRSDWIYIRFNDETWCHWAKEAGGFDLIYETTFQITDPGRRYGKREASENERQEDNSSDTKRHDRSLTREDIEAVIAFTSELRDVVAERSANSSTKSHEYSSEFREVVRKVVHEFHSRQFMYAFDYMSWMDEGRRLMEDDSALAQADLETIRKLLVVHWRSDYWDAENEHWEYVASTGHLTRLLERLETIASDMPKSRIDRMSKFIWEDGDIGEITLPTETRSSDFAITKRKSQKWTHELRLALYTRLLQEFGNYSTWGTVAYPSGRKAEMVAVLKELAFEFSEKSGKAFEWTAVEQQMRWGITRQGTVKNSGFAFQYIMNKAAALESGFLSSGDLTGFVHVERTDSPEMITLDDTSDDLLIESRADSTLNFIVYNNPDSVGELHKKEPLSVFTNKRVSENILGGRVWLITGEGRPRKYFLKCTFIIDEVGSGEEHGFSVRIKGSKGKVFDPMLEIQSEEWFLRLKKDQGNFAFGFNQISDAEAVEMFDRLAKAN